MKNISARLKNIQLLDAILLWSFFLSGCSALMYQVGWQRSLYGVIGVDIDSITIIVSVFMLGIGFGGMLGGWVADKAPGKRIQFYAVAELAIALYGLSSLALLDWVGDWVAATGGAIFWSGMASFMFLIVPTMLMGITLPLLTMAFNEWKKSIGVSVGKLYFFNTLGACTGAGLVPFVLLPRLPLDQVILLAALGNILVAVAALFAYGWQVLNDKKMAEKI